MYLNIHKNSGKYVSVIENNNMSNYILKILIH